ncbi:SpoIIE family protein phosphatase [Streptomyces sp. NA04227]|uniref:SpoIIE family protein phosphatase n=1 Tax=Streptomyces sp. NA04227 TaxID=2742136 RepID=UPI001590396C|nr:SpoIIE family protein phosphatase [Streptomyces sp. NA04227]QKW10968.1 SpoIIE family protein phosphatase [Streptomyces sp. NA04227]
MPSAGGPSKVGPGAVSPVGRPGAVNPALDATALINAKGTVVGWSRRAEELFGYAPADAVGRSAAFLLAEPADRVRARRVADRCRTGTGWSGTVAVRHREHHRMEVDLNVSAGFVLREGEDECFLVSVRERQLEWEIGQSVLAGFLTRSPIGMAVMDSDLQYVWLNDTLERFGGVPRAQRIGHRLGELLPGLVSGAIEATMRDVLRTGEPVIDHEYQGWSWADPHRQRSYSTSFFPLVDADDSITGVCYMVTDVTDRWKAQQRLALVNEAGARIGSSLDVMRTAQELADVAAPGFADFVIVDLLESVFNLELPTPLAPGSKPRMRRAGMQSVRTGCPEAVARIGDQVDFVPPPHDASYLVHGNGVLMSVLDPSSDLWAIEEPARAANMRDFGLHSLISVPVRARDTVLGLATFVRSENVASFEPDDMLLAQELVARAAVCIDNARRYTREHATALALQRSLLPQTLLAGTVLEVASSYHPADAKDGVGGDWFDVFPLSGARVALAVGDVVGHGITAAATMGRLRTAVHTLADMDLPPDELLAHLDDMVIRLIDGEPSDRTTATATATALLGATCLYAVYDPVTRHCQMARAGHPPPIVVAPDSTVHFPELPAGPPLGLGGFPFEMAEIELPEGGILGLYTDGLIEAADQDVDRGMTKLATALVQGDLPLEELCETTVQQLLPEPQPDDITLLLARPHPLTADQVSTWDMPSDPAVVAHARALASRHLENWGLGEMTATTEIVVSELVTNAIRHATGPIQLRLIRHSALICEVSDTSNTSPRLRHARTTDEGGRGLFLVAQLSRRWGTRYIPRGKIIWAEQDIPAHLGSAGRAAA